MSSLPLGTAIAVKYLSIILLPSHRVYFGLDCERLGLKQRFIPVATNLLRLDDPHKTSLSKHDTAYLHSNKIGASLRELECHNVSISYR